ncbi:MAG: hypothetical protein AAGF99_09665 [Bacteroidota bacterium]
MDENPSSLDRYTEQFDEPWTPGDAPGRDGYRFADVSVALDDLDLGPLDGSFWTILDALTWHEYDTARCRFSYGGDEGIARFVSASSKGRTDDAATVAAVIAEYVVTGQDNVAWGDQHSRFGRRDLDDFADDLYWTLVGIGSVGPQHAYGVFEIDLHRQHLSDLMDIPPD